LGAFYGRKIKDLRIFFGQYVQVPIAEVTNSMTPRTSASIALMHTHNMNGSVKFFDLNSTKVVTRDRWSEVELTQEIIDRINKIATSKKNQIGNSNLQITVSVNGRSVDDEEVEYLEEIRPPQLVPVRSERTPSILPSSAHPLQNQNQVEDEESSDEDSLYVPSNDGAPDD
jgi:hypothetical protein